MYLGMLIDNIQKVTFLCIIKNDKEKNFKATIYNT